MFLLNFFSHGKKGVFNLFPTFHRRKRVCRLSQILDLIRLVLTFSIFYMFVFCSMSFNISPFSSIFFSISAIIEFSISSKKEKRVKGFLPPYLPFFQMVLGVILLIHTIPFFL